MILNGERLNNMSHIVLGHLTGFPLFHLYMLS